MLKATPLPTVPQPLPIKLIDLTEVGSMQKSYCSRVPSDANTTSITLIDENMIIVANVFVPLKMQKVKSGPVQHLQADNGIK